ncbi:MAG: DUF1289 domain-containing protein [Gammaproteobacteria bacterium]|nr:DUF1289 domain-containing protein [Gammaproteobacteria bacterium]
MTKDVVRSPCVSICALDERDICVGCYRTGLEIAHWGLMTPDEKREVLRQVALREAQVFGGASLSES